MWWNLLDSTSMGTSKTQTRYVRDQRRNITGWLTYVTCVGNALWSSERLCKHSGAMCLQLNNKIITPLQLNSHFYPYCNVYIFLDADWLILTWVMIKQFITHFGNIRLQKSCWYEQKGCRYGKKHADMENFISALLFHISSFWTGEIKGKIKGRTYDVTSMLRTLCAFPLIFICKTLWPCLQIDFTT